MAEVMTLENGRTKLRHRNDVENSSGHSRFHFIQEATRKGTFATTLGYAKHIAEDHYYNCRDKVKARLSTIYYMLHDAQKEFLKVFENKNIGAKKQ